ncbi:DUF1361 domain-containing protein [Staphylococcus carnosus]|uniref:Membrane protein n=2 Tax=Staphylococcus carnosus TaxID=1281 RepID=B9DK57_STACT|nr:DUF1361 domain-containing protein [Staphylococcus carnosus]ANZ34027.1 hypothetical protein BEK99_09620 [Staphylococcus carnosus]KKB25085.1 hypothetical protein VV61_08405 [Staphylococcus carnosus]KOR14213.1 hypothetical protein AMC75_04930 [Staphylococcus carnosus]POA02267.1 DUF1361 domain-containing protein [Staphylococcus carnosus]QPT03439.1 DUF1361 domain-containing protein [Staphylococcus carnosus]
MQSRYIARILFVLLLLLTLPLNHFYNFMALNLFLAYIPFELVLLLPLFVPKRKFEWPLFIVFAVIFILILPNTFYMVTDLIHLNQFGFDIYHGARPTEWMYFTFLVSGVLFALYLYALINMKLLHLTDKPVFNYLIVIILVFTNSLGIFMGRFLRLHTVYLVNQPFSIFRDVMTLLDSRGVFFIFLMTVLQFLFLILIKGVRMVK